MQYNQLIKLRSFPKNLMRALLQLPPALSALRWEGFAIQLVTTSRYWPNMAYTSSAAYPPHPALNIFRERPEPRSGWSCRRPSAAVDLGESPRLAALVGIALRCQKSSSPKGASPKEHERSLDQPTKTCLACRYWIAGQCAW